MNEESTWQRIRAAWASEAPGMGIVRTIVTVGGSLLAILALLLLVTGQSIGEPPAVVIESGSMMHCGVGVYAQIGDACGFEDTGKGRIGTIDPGDVVLVFDVDGRGDVETFAEEGQDHYGRPGDVVVYERLLGSPIIHRAMFWIQVNEDGTYTIPELGLTTGNPAQEEILRDTERWNIVEGCQLLLPHGLTPEDSGFITKGDNNPCWDQSGNSNIVSRPVTPEQILGKSRAELPWVGLLKLFLSDPNNYAAAPAALKTRMWASVAVLVLGPYAYEYVMKRRRGAAEAETEEAEEPEATEDAPESKD